MLVDERRRQPASAQKSWGGTDGRDGWTDDCSRWQQIGRLASGEGGDLTGVPAFSCPLYAGCGPRSGYS